MSLFYGSFRYYTGKVYQVIDLVKHSETGEFFVLFEEPNGFRFVMPQPIFFGVVVHQGKAVYRFVKADDCEPVELPTVPQDEWHDVQEVSAVFKKE